VGAGIVGLAHAWAAARRGWEVLLFERNRSACGASIRNFGMVWPIGQPPGPKLQSALHSRSLWRQLIREARLWANECGSLHLAYRDDEWQVLREFAAEFASEYPCELLTPSEVRKASAAARQDGLLGGLWSRNEICIDPREVIARTPGWLQARYGIQCHFGVSIDRVATGSVTTSSGDLWRVDRVIVATGSELNILMPDLYAQAGFRRCKLQMMRTAPQSAFTLGPMLAGGLTLRHYEAFEACRSLPELKERITCETPELDHYGIHVMVAQNGLQELILGDSHEYDEQITPFDKAHIDDLMLRELRKIVDLPDWRIAERWHGIYVKIARKLQYYAEPEREVHVSIASGGCGMTMSFGLADEQWTAWDGQPVAAEPGGEAVSAR
jgi:FAD dependent oxidoreductase TIGR03364